MSTDLDESPAPLSLAQMVSDAMDTPEVTAAVAKMAAAQGRPPNPKPYNREEAIQAQVDNLN